MSRAPLPRGTVTFLFSDIEGSSELLRRVGDDVFAAIRGDHRRLLREAFTAHDGREIDTAGDGFFVAFDSARSAVAAAVKAQRSLAAFAWPVDTEIRVRMGLHTAEPYLGEDGYVGIGVHRAARICDAACGGQVLVSNATAGIIEDAELEGVDVVDVGAHRLKGLPRQQRLFQVMVDGLGSRFERPRTLETRPGVGTFLATDVIDFRRVIRLIGDNATAALTADYHSLVSGVVEANSGLVLERAGDYVLAVFHDASDAVRAAAAVREALIDFAWAPDSDACIAIAVHSGRWSGDPQRTAAGTTLVRLQRVLGTAAPGQVLVSQATAALLEGDPSLPPLRDLGERAIDIDEPFHLYELTAETG